MNTVNEYKEAREKVKACIVEHAGRFNMKFWFVGDNVHTEYESHACGTSACIGGNAVLSADGWKIIIRGATGKCLAMSPVGEVMPIENAAMIILGLDSDELLYLVYWPKELKNMYNSGGSSLRAKAACKAMDYFSELEDNA